ncbi:MFS transporter [Streptomyces tateyamensis]|uniref:MFS transporter n=1 Tax=Streptomyces tateyamensis TaxID=565073 RepID=UPI0015E8C0E9|nr:MFS transporter [Streptomyces tateyamensis]
MSTATVAAATTQRHRAASAVFLGAVFASAVGDEVASIAVLVHLAGSRQSLLIAALLVLQIAPAVLLAPLTGQLLDRRDAGRMLALASALQAVVLLAMSSWPSTGVLLAGTAAVGALGAVAAPAAVVLIPVVVGEAFPARANSLLELSRSASTLVGPVLGGVLVAAAGVRSALLADAVSFGLATLVIAVMRVRRPVAGDDRVWWQGATEGVRFLARQGELRAVLPILVFTVSASSMVNVATVFFVRGPLHAGGAALGLLTAAWGVGAMAGAAVASRREWRAPERAVQAGAAAMGLAILLYGAFAVLGVTVLMALLAGAANAYQNIAMRTAVQTRTPAELLGRAHAAAGSVVNTFFLVGFALGGVFAAADPRSTFVAAGAVTLAAAGAGLARDGLRVRRRAAPVAETEC